MQQSYASDCLLLKAHDFFLLASGQILQVCRRVYTIEQGAYIYLNITRNVGQDGGHGKKIRKKMASDNTRISIGI
jgi:ABC-type uncharacterized transport system ATPase subunit